jgi:hypothetical protein
MHVFGWSFAGVDNRYWYRDRLAMGEWDWGLRTRVSAQLHESTLIQSVGFDAGIESLSRLSLTHSRIGPIEPVRLFSSLHLLNSRYRSAQRSIGTISSGLGSLSHLNELSPINQGDDGVDNDRGDANANEPSLSTSDILLKFCGRAVLFACGIAIAGLSWFIMISRRISLGLNRRIAVFSLGYIAAVFCIWHALKFAATS